MRYISNKPLVVSGIALLLLVATLAFSTVRTVYADTETVSTSGERLLVIHDGSVERGVLTKATTLREVFEETEIPFDDNDLVEPSLDEELVATSYDVNIYRARPITVVDGAIRTKIMSAYRTPSQIVAHAGMELRAEDSTDMSVSTSSGGSGASIQLTITRATPVKLVLYGKRTTVYTQAKTVADMLSEKDISLGENDRLSVAENKAITAGMTIDLWREGRQTVTEEEKVDFGVEQIQDADRPVGYKQVKTPGVAGKRSVTYEIEMKNGKEVSRKEIQSVVLTQPKKQVEVVGAKVTGPAEIIDRITHWSNKRGIDPNRVARIARCESTFNPTASNGYHQGLFQHDPRYWPDRASRYGFAGASITSVEAQIAVSTGMMADGGWGHWECK